MKGLIDLKNFENRYIGTGKIFRLSCFFILVRAFPAVFMWGWAVSVRRERKPWAWAVSVRVWACERESVSHSLLSLWAWAVSVSREPKPCAIPCWACERESVARAWARAWAIPYWACERESVARAWAIPYWACEREGVSNSLLSLWP